MQAWGGSCRACRNSARLRCCCCRRCCFCPSLSGRAGLSTAVKASSSNGGSYDYDLFTIGAGSGGVRGSRFAASYGASSGLA